MKAFYILLIIGICIKGNGQTTRSSPNNHRGNISKNNTHSRPIQNQKSRQEAVVQPRETITERYLKGSSVKNTDADTSTGKNTASTSPFVGGVHAPADAGERFDTANKNFNPHNTNKVSATNATVTPVAAPNDTIFNVNAIVDNSVNTISGAVDRSGQAQFGQTNWGNSRSTVGESQWTVPPPITASFNKEFPSAGGTAWSRSNTDTSIYTARYKSGDMWITSNYSASGKRLDMRTEVPLANLPPRVSTYISKLPTNLQVAGITKWQVLGKADVYEIKTKTGKIIYVNNDGTEINYVQQ